MNSRKQLIKKRGKTLKSTNQTRSSVMRLNNLIKK